MKRIKDMAVCPDTNKKPDEKICTECASYIIAEKSCQEDDWRAATIRDMLYWEAKKRAERITRHS